MNSVDLNRISEKTRPIVPLDSGALSKTIPARAIPDIRYQSSITKATEVSSLEPVQASGPKLPETHYMYTIADIYLLCEKALEAISKSLENDIKVETPKLKAFRERHSQIVEEYAKAVTDSERWSVITNTFDLLFSAASLMIPSADVLFENPFESALMVGSGAVGLGATILDQLQVGAQLQKLEFLSKETRNALENSIRSVLLCTRLATGACSVALSVVKPELNQRLPFAVSIIQNLGPAFIRFEKGRKDNQAGKIQAERILIEGQIMQSRKGLEASQRDLQVALSTIKVITNRMATFVSDCAN